MNIEKLFRVALFTPGINGRWGLPIFNIADPGTSKSSQTESEARRYGLHCFTFIGSIHDPVDMSGLPAVDANGRFHYAPPSWAVELNEAGGGLLHLDELTTCQPAVQASMLRVLLNGAIGEYQLNPRVRIIASMNPPETAANGYDLSPPMANRGAHIKFPAPTASQWSNWLLSGRGDDARTSDPSAALALEEDVLKRFPAHFAKAKGVVTAFLASSPMALHRFPKEPTQQSGPWASARTWEMAVRALAGAELHDMSASDTEELVSGFIGAGTASEFFTFAQAQDLPAAVDVLEGRVKFTHDSARLDKTMTVLASCTAFTVEMVKTDESRAKRFAAQLWSTMEDIRLAGGMDLLVPATAILNKTLQTRTPKTDAEKRTTFADMVEAEPVLRALAPVLKSEQAKAEAAKKR